MRATVSTQIQVLNNNLQDVITNSVDLDKECESTTASVQIHFKKAKECSTTVSNICVKRY